MSRQKRALPKWKSSKKISPTKTYSSYSKDSRGDNDKFTALDDAKEGVENLKVRVFALEETSKKQASQIRELRMAK